MTLILVYIISSLYPLFIFKFVFLFVIDYIDAHFKHAYFKFDNIIPEKIGKCKNLYFIISFSFYFVYYTNFNGIFIYNIMIYNFLSHIIYYYFFIKNNKYLLSYKIIYFIVTQSLLFIKNKKLHSIKHILKRTKFAFLGYLKIVLLFLLVDFVHNPFSIVYMLDNISFFLFFTREFIYILFKNIKNLF